MNGNNHIISMYHFLLFKLVHNIEIYIFKNKHKNTKKIKLDE